MMRRVMTKVREGIEYWVGRIQGILALIGLSLTVIPMLGQTTEAGTWAATAGYVGISILIVIGLFGGLWSSGSKKVGPWEFMGESITLDKVDILDPRPVRIAVLGEKNTGKSTFIQAMRHNLVRSQIGANRPDPRLWVISLSDARNSHAVLFDVDGSSTAEEAKVLAYADHFIYFFDNHRDPSSSDMQPTRMKNASSDLNQFLSSYETVCVPRSGKVTQSPSVLLVMNKKDHWGKGDEGPARLEKGNRSRLSSGPLSL